MHLPCQLLAFCAHTHSLSETRPLTQTQSTCPFIHMNRPCTLQYIHTFKRAQTKQQDESPCQRQTLHPTPNTFRAVGDSLALRTLKQRRSQLYAALQAGTHSLAVPKGERSQTVKAVVFTTSPLCTPRPRGLTSFLPVCVERGEGWVDQGLGFRV